MGGHAAEQQIIAGVVLGERLAVTMYGAIHRAQLPGQQNLRGLVVDAKLLAEGSFRGALADDRAIARASALQHPNIVPTVAVAVYRADNEAGGSDVVVVTRGGGRHVTVQDLVTAARAGGGTGTRANAMGAVNRPGRLAPALAATIARSVVEALAAAHSAGVVHGAVHPRSVLVDEEGHVRLDDFVVSRALTMAVVHGADSGLWRGLAGYLAPELAVGEEPTTESDVYAVGALLFTMIAGEPPPGSLRSTPAVERLVNRALDTDIGRRYRNAKDLLENLLEAFDDDRWTYAPPSELVKAAGLSFAGGTIDDATEDLLASLGQSVVQVTPTRPSMDLHAKQLAVRHAATPSGARLDALLADLDERSETTDVDAGRFNERGRAIDPISEIIKHDPRRQDAIATPARGVKRVPTFDADDEDEDLRSPSPQHSALADTATAAMDALASLRPPTTTDVDAPRAPTIVDPRSPYAAAVRGSQPAIQHHHDSSGIRRDEAAALNAIAGLDEPVRRVSSAAEVAEHAAKKLEEAAKRAEAAASRVDESKPIPRTPLVEPVPDLEAKPVRLKSRLAGAISLLLLVGGGVAFYVIYQSQQASNEERAKAERAAKAALVEKEQKLIEAQIDAGALVVTSTPTMAGVWLRIGRTPVETMRLKAEHTHDIALLLDGHRRRELQVGAASWTGTGDQRKATISATLEPLAKADKKTKQKAEKPATLPMQPTAAFAKTAAKGAGPIRIESTPSDAEAYLFVGVTGSMKFNQLVAGRDYEVVVVKDGYKPRHITIKSEEWRDGGDPNIPLDVAKKKSTIEKVVELEPAAVDQRGP